MTETCTLELPADMLSDYDDGFALMTKVMKRLSSAAVVDYAEENGPRLDSLKDDGLFFSGMADALASQCAAALDRMPALTSAWLHEAIIHVTVNGRDKTFRVERRVS